ncbi:MAG: HAD-IIB family hydrolase, partial [Rhodovibrionaceae bacterium]|nr:HAD-IIB family hydrolase [Rhodovibrionaceae bacterium]
EAALAALRAARIPVVAVSGRAAGWCEDVALNWPVDAVVGENGACYMLREADGSLSVRCVQDEAERAANRRRLLNLAAEALRRVPRAELAHDLSERLADIAIDYAERVGPLDDREVADIVSVFHEGGAHAQPSSIHVNCWFGDFDKLTTTRLLMSERFGVDLDVEKAAWIYVGDAPNDAPMFGFFPHAVAVANFRRFAGQVKTLPAYLTDGERGAGFAEVAQAILDARGLRSG